MLYLFHPFFITTFLLLFVEFVAGRDCRRLVRRSIRIEYSYVIKKFFENNLPKIHMQTHLNELHLPSSYCAVVDSHQKGAVTWALLQYHDKHQREDFAIRSRTLLCLIVGYPHDQL